MLAKTKSEGKKGSPELSARVKTTRMCDYQIGSPVLLLDPQYNVSNQLGELRKSEQKYGESGNG